MIGAVLYRLVSCETGKMQKTSGRCLHAAFFKIVSAYSAELASILHDNLRFKSFTVSELYSKKSVKHTANFNVVHEGDVFYWRVTALNETILQALVSVPEGYHIQIGALSFRLEKTLMDSSDFGATAILDENELIAACLGIDKVKRISFSFISPVSFRSFEDDYPFPLPQLVFGSIVDKWNLADMPVKFDKDEVREIAAKILPESWRGQTKQVFLKKDRGVTGFIGDFTFNVGMLSRDMQQLLLLLAQFAQFSGVGRLTTQGLGQTKVLFQ